MKPEELELLNIPEEEYKTKSKEEVEAIAAALDKAHEKSQYSVVLKSTATYAENEPILRLIDKKRKATRAITGEKGYYHSSGAEEDEEYRMTYSNDMPSRSGEVDEGMGGDWDDLLSQIMNHSSDANAAKMAERAADLVDAGNIDAATDLIADIMNNTSDADTSEIAEKAYDAVEALQMNEARMGEYGKMDAEQGLPPTKIGRGNEEYMAAYNAVLVARGEEPLDIQQPDQAYLDALRSGQLQEAVDKRARQLLSEGLTPEQVKEKIIEEGIGDFLRKGADFVKAKTGLGRTTKTRELYSKMKFEKDKYFEFRDKFYPDATDVRNFMEFVEQNARKQGGGRGGMMSDLAYRAISREKFKTMDSPITYLKQARKLANNIEKMMLDGAVDQKGDKTFKVIRSMAESIMKDFEQARAYLKELRVAIKRAQKSGSSQALKDIYKDQVEHERYLSQSQARADKAFAAKAKEAERKARKNKPKDDEDMIRGKSTERFGLATNLEENEKKKFKVGEFVRIVAGSLKGATGKVIEPITTSNGEQGYVIELYSSAKMKVFGGPGDEVIATADEMESGGTTDGMELYDIDERSKDDERDLEKPVKYGSGAELEFDKKAQKFYDRKRDMYIDDPEEEDNLIREKDEKEFAKIFARAKDMLVLSARSRVPVSLKSVQSALDVIKVPSEMEKGKLIVKNEYVIADKNELPESAKQISFTKYAMDYLSNLPGEQLDLPMEEEQARTTVSSDPEMDQIEDIALSVIEKFGGLMGIASRLKEQGFDASVANGALNIDGKYFMGKAENFDISPEEEVRKVGKYVLGYMG